MDYPEGVPEDVSLKEAARLIRETPSVAYIAINSGSINNGSRWDTHDGQVRALNTQVKGLAEAIAAFRQDVGNHWDRILIVIQTEFGRTLVRNNIAAAGTQHGHATALLLMGGPVTNSPHSGRIAVNDWPGIAASQSYERKYLARTTDVRTVLCEILERHMLVAGADSLFPTFDRAANPDLGILAPGGLPGDADASGTVDSTDIERVLARLIGENDSALSETLADYDRNRTIELRDALLIARDLKG